MKLISLILFTRLILFFLILLTSVNANEEWNVKNLPFKKSNLQSSYILDDGDIIHIEKFERGDRIWKYDLKNQTFKKLTFVWNFITLAKYCEGISEKDIYFAVNLEYYLGGGTIIDNPQIRIFSLDDSSPWRDSDLGIVPNIDWAKQFCEFY
tara:strand:- start:6 stop:461 length:456 start_codon:yes stop_codon:yes gene_type:complete